ncbi:MAG TPA: galactokinase, partial [Chitinophagales bacterium]|nr:galactokinase [Chitinophagales bacterium]
IMDQFAVAMGQHNNAILLDCQTLKFQYVPFQSRKYTLLILNSNKPRQLTESKYNERKSECDQALAILQQQYPHIKNLCEAQLVELDAIPFDILYRRAYHVVTENQRTVAAAKALVENDWLRLGELFNESQFSLRDMYEVTGFELDILVELAQQLEGCIGARMTGAGFGGCAIALVETDRVTDFKITLALQYQKLVQLPLSIYEATAENGVDTVA